MVKLVVNVVAAIFHEGDKVFAAKRAYGSMKGFWEFPGGKIEKNEDPKEALAREIKEELSSSISHVVPREIISMEYPDFFLYLHVFDAEVDKASIVLNPEIHSNGGFYSLDELRQMRFCPADQTLIKEDIMREKYPFYNAEHADMRPINDSYLMIEDVRAFYDLLNECWGPDSCSSRLRGKWSKENKTLAQCSPTSFLAQEIFGGEVLGTPLQNGLIHCFNKIDGVVFDLTSEQFHGEKVNYDDCTVQNKDETFAKEPEKEQRYKALKGKLDKLLGK